MEESKPSGKRRGRRWPIVVGVIAAVVVAAGAGFGVWHEQPSFCNAVCHDWEGVLAATEDWGGEAGVNPHASHQGEAVDCSYCHGAHGSSYMYCNACHDYAVPDGWESPR